MLTERFLVESTWYLSANGRDSFNCGRSISTACKTLDCVLERFYNGSFTTKKNLILVTNSSLMINNSLVVGTVLHFKILKLNFLLK